MSAISPLAGGIGMNGGLLPNGRQVQNPATPVLVAGGVDANGNKLIQMPPIHNEGCNFCTTLRNGLMTEAEFDKFKQQNLANIMAHEMAHKSAAGYFGGAIQIDYDSNNIAIAGHVPITFPPIDEKNPEQAIQGATQIRDAAYAPSDPSTQDKFLAGQAMAILGRAKVLLDQKNQKNLDEKMGN